MLTRGLKVSCICFCILLLCSSGINFQKNGNIVYLPLGDSYTICTGAKAEESWPVLLSAHLAREKIPCKLAANPARNGFTTQDLIDKELPLCRKLKPGFVSILIGVNDWVRGIPKEAFHKNLRYILDEVTKNLAEDGKVLLITIPDFGVTPEGKNYSNGRNIGKGLQEFNALIKQEAGERNLQVVDLFDLSKKMGEDVSLVAADGLHPSAKEYAIWETVISKAALSILK